MFSYQNSTALITGGSSGIGHAILRALLKKGVSTVVMVARNADKLVELTEEFSDSVVRLVTIAVDLTDPEAVSHVQRETDQSGLQIDLLVNDAGIGSVGPFDDPITRPGNDSSAHIEPRQGLEKLSVSTPNTVASVALDILDRNQPYAVVGAANKTLSLASRFLPAPFMAGLLARIRRSQVLAMLGKSDTAPLCTKTASACPLRCL